MWTRSKPSATPETSSSRSWLLAGFEDAEEVGYGGFGVVYRCTQVSLDRTVAVKVLTNEDGEGRQRFAREQRAMGQLTGHPNIMGVLQIGELSHGAPYLVMQYYERGSLDQWIRERGPLPIADALRIAMKLSEALATAHSLGILHRDVKPANILFDQFAEPILSDFGIARLASGFETGTNVVAASPAFAAPEVLSGVPSTPASDVYGVGATMFCALASRLRAD